MITLFAMVSGDWYASAHCLGRPGAGATVHGASSAPDASVPNDTPCPVPGSQGATVTFCKWNTARGLPEEHRNRQITIFLLECAFGATLGLLPHPQWLRHR